MKADIEKRLGFEHIDPRISAPNSEFKGINEQIWAVDNKGGEGRPRGRVQAEGKPFDQIVSINREHL